MSQEERGGDDRRGMWKNQQDQREVACRRTRACGHVRVGMCR